MWLAFLCLAAALDVAAEVSLEAEARVLLAREPMDALELQDLAATDDVLAVPSLDAGLTRRVSLRASFGDGVAPRALEDEIVAALEGLARLEPRLAEARAREIVDILPPGAPPSDAARRVLARSGDIDLLREALGSFFERPEHWGAVLGEAARARDDPRLLDFFGMAPTLSPPVSSKLARTRRGRSLSGARAADTLRALLQWAAASPRDDRRKPLVVARLLSRLPGDARYAARIDAQLARLASRKGETDEERAARLHALMGLGRRAARSHTPLLLEALEQEDVRTAAVAARALGELAEERVVPLLRKRLETADEPARSEIVTALVRLRGRAEAERVLQQDVTLAPRGALSILDVVAGDSDAVASLVSRLESESRPRVLRALAERDLALLGRVSLTTAEVDDLYPFLPRSSFRDVRRKALDVSAAVRGRALAALLASPRATLDEKEDAVRVLGEGTPDVWPEVLLAGGADAIAEIRRLSVRHPSWEAFLEPQTWLGTTGTPPSRETLDALALLPSPAARQALEQVGTAGAIERLLRRADRALAMPALDRLGRESEGELRQAAERALLLLDAPGARALMQRKLAAPESLRAMVPVLAKAPLALEAFRHVAREEPPFPEVLAALFGFYKRDPRGFLPLLSNEHPVARRRIRSTIALAGDPARLPLLVEWATLGDRETIRRAAFWALMESDAAAVAPRLHRALGDPDREIRLAAAMVLVPAGGALAVRALVAEVDSASAREVEDARRALEHLPAAEARGILERMIRDETARSLAVDVLLRLAEREGEELPRELRARAWRALESRGEEDGLTLDVASRLDVPEAAVTAAESLVGR